MMEKVTADIKEAMKSKDKLRLDALRMLKSAFIENNTSAKPRAEADVAIAHVKKLKDSLASFPAGSPEVAKIEADILCLADYVPQAMNADQLREFVKNFLSAHAGADFAQVMKVVAPEIKGRFDGKLAADIVKSMLA